MLNGKIDVNNIDSDESSRVMSIELKDISSEKKSALGIPYGTVMVAVTDEDLLNGEEMTYTLSASAAGGGGNRTFNEDGIARIARALPRVSRVLSGTLQRR